MSNFASMMSTISDISSTENGGRCFSTTGGGALLDLFSSIGGMRNRDESDIINMWRAAREEDKELADNLILYTRNIRECGLGERKIGRLLIKELAKIDPSKVSRNLDTIVKAGRWDDLFCLIGTDIEGEVWKFIENQLRTDVSNMKNNQPISLCAKWMPSINTSSKETRRLARKACVILGVSERSYRKMLSALRKYIDVVEKKISAREWDSIEFDTVPSVAMNRYINSFNRNCPESFSKYKESLVKGEAKVNASVLYPYDLVKNYIRSYNSWGGRDNIDVITEEQWKALPNYVNDGDDVLFVCDTSGSMLCYNYEPISTAVGLSLYFAQRNKGAYHNMFMTFSSNPEIRKIDENWSLQGCLDYVLESKWGMSTNLDKTFKLIFDIAKEARDVPKALVIVSDMEINQWGSTSITESISQKWRKKFNSIGLEMPKLIYWNVACRNNNILSQCNENISYVSGYGIGAFNFLQTLINKSAYEAMKEILTNKAFNWK